MIQSTKHQISFLINIDDKHENLEKKYRKIKKVYLQNYSYIISLLP